MSVLKLILLNPAKKIEVLKGHSISWCWAAIVWKNPWRNMFPRIPARKALCTGASQHPRSSSIRLAEDNDSQRFFSTGWRWANWSNWSNWWCYHVTIPKEWFQDDFRGSADCCRQISQLLWWEGHCPSQLLAKCHQPCHPRWGTWRMFVFKGNSTEYCRCQMPI